MKIIGHVSHFIFLGALVDLVLCEIREFELMTISCQQIEEKHLLVFLKYILEMLVKRWFCFLVFFDLDFVVLWLLGPEKGHRPSDLDVWTDDIFIFKVDHHFGLNEIRNVSVLIYTSCFESSSCHTSPPSGKKSQLKVSSHKSLGIISLTKALYDR